MSISSASTSSFGLSADKLTLGQLVRRLSVGEFSSRELVESCLEKIEDTNGEGARAFRTINAQARELADEVDASRAAGRPLPIFAGIPISIKDLFDAEGESTLAGSEVLADRGPAENDAPAIARLRAAGFILVGRTNMTEFAFSGLGLNPHFGTPMNPYDRDVGRIPGGSSSGAAVSVTDGMAVAGLGTDTGGSCRIPAAMCGIVGFKPTARRISLEGVTPLSSTLDSVGSLASTVSCCAAIDSVIADERATDGIPAKSPSSLCIGVLRNYVFEDVEEHVGRVFERSLSKLSVAGMDIRDISIDSLEELPEINAGGGFVAAESFAWHRQLLADRWSDYDPRVRVRIEKGRHQSAADYLELLSHRTRLIRDANSVVGHLDALVFPTVPMIAPPLPALEDDDEYARVNLLALRNPSVTNFLDGCAVSIPIHEQGEAPVGMNVMGRTMGDRELLAVAAILEDQLAYRTAR